MAPTTADMAVGATIIQEIAVRELPYWCVGVCTIRFDASTGELYVTGESGHALNSWVIDEYTDNFTDLADEVTREIKKEHDRL